MMDQEQTPAQPVASIGNPVANPAVPAVEPAAAQPAAAESAVPADSNAVNAAPAVPAASADEPVAAESATDAPVAGEAPAAGEAPVDELVMLETLKQVIDPELMINIVDLGLIYSIAQEGDLVNVEMTLTSPACPAGPQLIGQSKMALEQLAGVREANIKLVLSPPWTPDRMTDEARDQLGIF